MTLARTKSESDYETMLVRIAAIDQITASPIVAWKSVFSNPRRVRWIEPESPPNPPLNDELFPCSKITRISTTDRMIMTI